MSVPLERAPPSNECLTKSEKNLMSTSLSNECPLNINSFTSNNEDAEDEYDDGDGSEEMEMEIK